MAGCKTGTRKARAGTGEVVALHGLKSENRFKEFSTTYFLDITERGTRAVRSGFIASRGRLKIVLVVQSKYGSSRGFELRGGERAAKTQRHPPRADAQERPEVGHVGTYCTNTSIGHTPYT